MISCAITDLAGYGIDPAAALASLETNARRWSVDGIELVQLREKTLASGDLLRLAVNLQRTFEGTGTRLLINNRVDVAVAAGAAGVHLPATSGALTPEQVRMVFSRAGRGQPLISVSCHTLEEVRRARENGADFILFGPVFGKILMPLQANLPGTGLALLHQAVEEAGGVPVLALGGVMRVNAPACVAAGAAGVAGIQLFR